MEKEVKVILSKCKIKKNDLLILSISGGIDSMSMLHYFVSQKYRIEVVHFNHQIREQSATEAAMVEQYCKENDIPYHYYTIDVDHGNFHHQAHILRQQYLHDVAHVARAKYILTAHHLDDLLESILIKITRGSNLLGYAGMQPCHKDKDITLVKPLLYVSKEKIAIYAKTNHVTYLDDISNFQDAYLRNRYRHAVVPIMKQENDALLVQTKQYHEQITLAFSFIRKTTLAYLKNKKSIDVTSFLLLDEAIQNDVLAHLLDIYHIHTSFEKIQTIKQIIYQKAPNRIYRLNKKYYFIKQYNHAEIKEINTTLDVKIKVSEGQNKLPNMAVFTFLSNSSVKTDDLQKLCYNKLAFPLWLRYRKDGDILSFVYGHKKLKKLLIDKKVPLLKRNQLWVLTDSNDQILWVQDYYSNETLGKDHCIYFSLKEHTNAT